MAKLSKLLGLLLIPVLVGIFSYKTASAFFNDTETSSGNLFAAAATFPSPSSSASPNPSPSVSPSASPSVKPSSNPCANNNGVISGNSFSKNFIDITCITSTSSAQINNANINNTVVVNSTTGGNSVTNTNGGSNNTTSGNGTINVNVSTSTNTSH